MRLQQNISSCLSKELLATLLATQNMMLNTYVCQHKLETFNCKCVSANLRRLISLLQTQSTAQTRQDCIYGVLCVHTSLRHLIYSKVNSLRALKQMTSQAHVKRTVSLLFCALMRLICLRLVGAGTIVYPWVTLISPKGS